MADGPRGCDRIRLAGVAATGYHGVLPHEREDGQEFMVDVTMWARLVDAARSDDIADTVNYAEVAAVVVAEIRGEPVNLIESLADRIAGAVLTDARVRRVEVTVHKPGAPVGVPVGDVAVTVVRGPE